MKLVPVGGVQPALPPGEVPDEVLSVSHPFVAAAPLRRRGLRQQERGLRSGQERGGRLRAVPRPHHLPRRPPHPPQARPRHQAHDRRPERRGVRLPRRVRLPPRRPSQKPPPPSDTKSTTSRPSTKQTAKTPTTCGSRVMATTMPATPAAPGMRRSRWRRKLVLALLPGPLLRLIQESEGTVASNRGNFVDLAARS